MAATGGRRGKLARPRRSRRSGAPRTQYLHPTWRSPRWTPLLAALLGLVLTVLLARAVAWVFDDPAPQHQAAAGTSHPRK